MVLSWSSDLERRSRRHATFAKQGSCLQIRNLPAQMSNLQTRPYPLTLAAVQSHPLQKKAQGRLEGRPCHMVFGSVNGQLSKIVLELAHSPIRIRCQIGKQLTEFIRLTEEKSVRRKRLDCSHRSALCIGRANN